MPTPVAPPQRTTGQVITSASALMFGGLALVAVGSIGPWATSPLTSVSGLNGDGKWTILLAAIAAFMLVRRGQPDIRAGIACLAILGFGIYDAIHIHPGHRQGTFNGAQLDHRRLGRLCDDRWRTRDVGHDGQAPARDGCR